MKKRHFFEAGDNVQWESRNFPGLVFDALHGTTERLHGTIKQIERRPDPDIFEDPADWHRGPHWTLFWVEIENLPELVGREIPFRYRELRPSPRISHT